MYEFITGFMFWLALGVCLTGVIVRTILYFRGLQWNLDRVAYKAYPVAGFMARWWQQQRLIPADP